MSAGQQKWPVASGCVVIALSLVLTVGCSREGSAELQPAQLAPVETAISAESLNDAARFLAGLPGRQQSAFHDLESTPAWQEYSKSLDKTWTTTEARQFATVRAFEERELKPISAGSTFLFYPFSGPDVLYATQFFPRSNLYVMAGLEPVGNLKLPANFHSETLPDELRGLGVAANSIFRRSYFITKEMESHFHSEAADGLLPVIVMLLARSGYVFDGMRLGEISPEGVFVALPVDAPKHQAVELVFHAFGDAHTRKTLYYVSTDLAGRYNPQKGFGKFVELKGRHATLVKSATYLLHSNNFSKLRNHILASSDVILEDDSGLPYHTLNAAPWEVQLYGHYSAPGAPFKAKFQQDLNDAFEDAANIRPLPFRIGYGYGQRSSSLILAVRKAE